MQTRKKKTHTYKAIGLQGIKPREWYVRLSKKSFGSKVKIKNRLKGNKQGYN